MKLILAIRDWLHRWYSEDRIRLSPSRGSLVRLKTGDRVLIRENLFVVVDQKAIFKEHVSQVDYRLHEQDSTLRTDAKLSVELIGKELKFVSAKLEYNGEIIELFEDDPVIVSPDVPPSYA